MTAEYIEGFTKTAAEYGFDARSLLKAASGLSKVVRSREVTFDRLDKLICKLRRTA